MLQNYRVLIYYKLGSSGVLLISLIVPLENGDEPYDFLCKTTCKFSFSYCAVGSPRYPAEGELLEEFLGRHLMEKQ